MEKLYTKEEMKLFSQPLIIGASISAGYGTKNGGPAAVLARKINPAAKITNRAVSGATSVQSTGRLEFSRLNPSIVLGLDLFFWDAVRGQVGRQFEENTRKLFEAFQSRNIPMIIGKIPVVDFPFGLRAKEIKKSTEKINSLLEEYCTLEKNSLLYDPLDCFIQMNSEDHFSDGLHLTCEGNEFCANFLASSGEFKKLKGGPEMEVA